MTPPRHVALFDIGKTNAKLVLVDRATLAEVALRRRPNRVLPGPPWPHYDTAALWSFLLDGLAECARGPGVDAIVVATHGAAAALIGEDGALAAPVLDYEHPGPEALAAAYDRVRPAFAETGSPRLPQGQNLGAQLHWQIATTPGLRERVRRVVTWPQYWGFRLTGVAACDWCSLGAHSDLWAPAEGRFSALVDRLGLAGRIAPPRPPGEVLGPVLPEIAARTGLRPGTPVLTGIHDSNASLLPHLLARPAPFSVVSTGTWVIAMAVGGAPVALDPARDTLMNVNAFGQPVPSARFMGGRVHEVAMAGQAAEPSSDGTAAVLDGGVMLLPTLVPGSGPYMGRRGGWTPREPAPGTGERAAAVAFHLALVTARCLALIGHAGAIVVEGPFARNAAFLDMLGAATGAPVVASEGGTGTSQGAALLAAPGGPLPAALPPRPPLPAAATARFAAYARAWTTLAEAAR
jgi:sugar (pentulose or hexulose) kinase